MSWRLVASTTTGWKKYETDTGNYRYKRPNGKFASESQYNGSLSTSVELDEKDETEDIGFTPPPPSDPYDEIEEKEDLKTYKRARDYLIYHERSICVGISIINWERQFNKLWNIVEDIDILYDKFSFGIHYTVVKEENSQESEVHTNMRTKENSEPVGRIEFIRMGQKLEDLCDSYKEVIVHDVRLKARKY